MTLNVHMVNTSLTYKFVVAKFLFEVVSSLKYL